MKYRDDILQLRSEGKTYNEIMKITGASKSTISYHCGINQKQRTARRKGKNTHPFIKKIDNFKSAKKKLDKETNRSEIIERVRIQKKIESFHRNRKSNMYTSTTFTIKDVLSKFGEAPKCYLTGKTIDIYNTKSYHFDHVVPVSKGGESIIDNLGICTRDANHAKHDMLLDDFVSLCKQVLENRGYIISNTN